MKKTEFKYLCLLLIAAFIWGSTFVAQSTAMDHVGPFTFLAIRSYIGGLFLTVLLPFFNKLNKVDNASKEATITGTDPKAARRLLLIGGSCAGIMLLIASGSQQIGMPYTTVGKAGFLTAMYVIFVPFINRILFKKRIPLVIWIAVGLSVIGMGFLCLNGSARPAPGDLIELFCGLAFACHILVIDHFTEKLDPVKLSCVQFFVCGILSTVIMFIFEKPSMTFILAAWFPICYAGFLSSGIAFTLQAVAQKKCDPTLASLVMCLESVFSVISGWLILHETLSAKEILGCALMFGAIVLSNLAANKKA